MCMESGHEPKQEMEQNPEQNPEEYSFMQEVIKDEKRDVSVISKKIGKWALAGVVFGAAACMGFFALKPWAETVFQKDADQVEIPKDDDTEKETESEITEPVQQELTIDSYRELNRVLTETASEAKKSVVMVTGIRQDENWTSGQSKASLQTSGLIVADNGREVLILTGYSDMKNASLFQVQFIDGTEHEAVMKQKDGNLNLAVFSVAKSGITQETWEKIKVAVLGNSNTLVQGRTLLAMGSPFGYEDGFGVGVASSVGASVIRADGEFQIVVTDMPATKKGSGFLFDSYGSAIGIIDAGLMGENGAETLTGIGISAVKSEIELMCNGKNVPYIGVTGTIVTSEMSQVQEIPEGLYVTEVEVDSPAMKAGIQSGDVITKVGDAGIGSLGDYHKAVLKQEAGKTITLYGQRRGAENFVDIKFNVTVGIKQ